MPSIAILTHICLESLPYINYFISYYDKIGIDSFYLINTQPSNYEVIDSYLSQHNSYTKLKVENVQLDTKDNLDTYYSKYLENIKEEYTLNINSYAYLNINNIKEYCNLLFTNNIPIINFRWFMYFNDDITCKQHNVPITLWDEGTSLFKTNIAKQIINTRAIPNNNIIDNNKYSTTNTLINLWCLNFNNIIIKSLDNINTLKNNITHFTLPTTYILLAYLKHIQPDKIINLDANLGININNYIDTNLEQSLIFKNLTINEYNIIFKLYCCYEYYFSCIQNVRIKPLKALLKSLLNPLTDNNDTYIKNIENDLKQLKLSFIKDSNKLFLPSINNLLLDLDTQPDANKLVKLDKFMLLPQKFIVNDDIQFFPNCNILVRNFENTFITTKKILITLHPICKLYLFYNYLINYTSDNIRILSFKENIDGLSFNMFITTFIKYIDITKYIFTQPQNTILLTNNKFNIHDYTFIKYDNLFNDTILDNKHILDTNLLTILKAKHIPPCVNINYKSYIELKPTLSKDVIEIIKNKYKLDLEMLNYEL
jgi:hypothetical protein